MRSVGLLGGLGPESAIDYYRRILDAWKDIDPATAPSIVIDSLDVQRASQRRGLRRLALLGTRFTMEGGIYPPVFARQDGSRRDRRWVSAPHASSGRS